MTHDVGSRQRFAKGQHLQTELMTHALNKLGIKRRDNITDDLKPSNIKAAAANVKKLKKAILDHLNPFENDFDKTKIFNISSGRAAPDQVASFLLGIEKFGNKKRIEFIKNCSEDKSFFEKCLTKRPLLNFKSLLPKRKIKLGDKSQEIKWQVNLFGKLLAISLNEDLRENKALDITKLMTYPLSIVPLSLCHLNGLIHETAKSALLEILEKKVISGSPEKRDVLIIDGFFYLRTLPDLPGTFGDIARQIMKHIAKNEAEYIHLIFDTYPSPSIKDYQHQKRGGIFDEPYVISGSMQKRSPNFHEALKNVSFKIAFVKFLIQAFAENEMVPFISNKTVYINFDKCYVFKACVNSYAITLHVIEQFSCMGHEEADTKIAFHLINLFFETPNQNNNINVEIRTSDTDVLVILLGNYHNVAPNIRTWIKLGVGSYVRYIDVTRLYENIGKTMCKSLPAFHALTGCDYNPSIHGKGKKTAFKILEYVIRFQEAFGKIGSVNDRNIDVLFVIIQEFICHLYGEKRYSSVNELRAYLLLKKYDAKNPKTPFNLEAIKNSNPSTLPPCESTLREHFLRTVYITSIWSNCHLKYPTRFEPINYGYKLQSDVVTGRQFYDFRWYSCEMMPSDIKDILINKNIDLNGKTLSI